MRCTYLAALALGASALTLVPSGCGGSTKSATRTAPSGSAQPPAGGKADVTSESSTSSGSLTRAQLIARGNAICYRLNARRSSTRISRPQDYERLVPVLAAYELAAATEMSKLTPPASMARDWRQMIAGSRTIAEVTGHFQRYSEAGNEKKSRPLDAILGKAIEELTSAAKHAGFKDCAQFT
jgi:hypothetical protein